MSDEAVRKEFEAWALSQWSNLDIDWCAECSSGGHYETGSAQNLYAAWQASRSAAIQECADATSEEVEQIAAAADDSVLRERLLTIAQRVYAAALALKER